MLRARSQLARFVLAACACVASIAGTPVKAAPQIQLGSTCAAYLPRAGAAVKVMEWRLDPATGIINLKQVATTEARVDNHKETTVYRLSTSDVMKAAMALDRSYGALTMPGIADGGVEARVGSGCEWAARETVDAQSVNVGMVAVTAGEEPGVCEMTARFRKVVNGRAVVDEDFLATYPCGVTP